jgi:hypothetical protein
MAVRITVVAIAALALVPAPVVAFTFLSGNVPQPLTALSSLAVGSGVWR